MACRLFLGRRKPHCRVCVGQLPSRKRNENNAKSIDFYCHSGQNIYVAAIAAPPLAPPFGNWTRLSADPIVSPQGDGFVVVPGADHELLVSQRDHRIHLRSAPRRQKAGKGSNDSQKSRRKQNGHRIRKA